MKTSDYPKNEQPTNRICEVGPQMLSGVEILAVILQTRDSIGDAQKLFNAFGSLEGIARASVAEIAAIKGFGKGMAARIKAAVEMGKRVLLADMDDRYQIRSPHDVFKLLEAKYGDAEQELFIVLHLDTRNRIVDDVILYKGTINTSVVRIAEVFRGAIRNNSTNIIVAHNHPSGDPSPSAEDVQLTRALVLAGKSLEINVLDHIVIGRGRSISLRDRQLGFEEV